MFVWLSTTENELSCDGVSPERLKDKDLDPDAVRIKRE